MSAVLKRVGYSFIVTLLK